MRPLVPAQPPPRPVADILRDIAVALARQQADEDAEAAHTLQATHMRTAPMYVTTRSLYDQGRTIPAGTRLSDVYEMPDQTIAAIAHVLGQRIKLRLIKTDLKIAPLAAGKSK